jgi:hypothetical protein
MATRVADNSAAFSKGIAAIGGGDCIAWIMVHFAGCKLTSKSFSLIAFGPPSGRLALVLPQLRVRLFPLMQLLIRTTL